MRQSVARKYHIYTLEVVGRHRGQRSKLVKFMTVQKTTSYCGHNNVDLSATDLRIALLRNLSELGMLAYFS